MSNTKCVSCGKTFFSPLGHNKCGICSKKEGASSSGMEDMGHGSCGCGGHHHH